MEENNDTIGEIVRELESNFISGNGTLSSKYVTTDLYEDINTIYAYLNSKHTSGEYDSMGREKPFFNIVIASRNIWFRATKRHTKDVTLRARKAEDTMGVFLMSVHLQDWMTRERFGAFLNNWGLELAGFNSAISKFIEKDGKLNCSVIPWSKMICDQIDFANNPKIEILELTEAQLYERGYDEEQVKAMCDSSKARELTNKQKSDNKKGYYKLYEVHGKFPLEYLTDKEKDSDTFVQQMQVLSFVAQKGTRGKKTQWDEFVLYKGKEEKDPYMLTALLPATDGSISLDGSVKNLFQAQWMLNHTKKQIKDQLDLASKLIFQTSDGNFVGQNALNAIEQGDILIHAMNQPLTQLQNNSHDIVSLQNFGAEWKGLSSEINGISDAMLGIAPKAGTAWKQVEANLIENHSLFEEMGLNKDLAIEDMLRLHILPFLKKKMNNADEISATLSSYNIDKIDKKYVPYEATKRLAKKIIKQIIQTGTFPAVNDQMQADHTAEVKAELDAQGNQRFFVPNEIDDTTWKELFKDVEFDIEVVNDESSNTQEVLQTLNTALNVVANPNFQNNPKAQFIIDKILQKTGHISAMELSAIPEPTPAPQPIQPAQPISPVAPNGGAGVGTGNLIPTK
jgi:hypothetical protein